MHKQAEAQYCTRQRFPPDRSCITQWVITPVHSSQHTSPAASIFSSVFPSSRFKCNWSQSTGWTGECEVLEEMWVTGTRLQIHLSACFEGKERLGGHPGQRLCSSAGRSGGVKAAGLPTSIECLYLPTLWETHCGKGEGRVFLIGYAQTGALMAVFSRI